MSKIETITTRIRPIKKVCIIENDFQRLFEVIKNYTEDVGGFYNLILINNESLFRQNTIDFVKSHDPDLILNYSNRESEQLKNIFKTKVINANNDGFSYDNIRTPLEIIDNVPESARIEIIDKENFLLYHGDGSGPTHSYLSLNFGIISARFFEKCNDTDFLKTIQYSSISPFFQEFGYFKHKSPKEKTLIDFSNLIFRPIWSLNIGSGNNNDGYFLKYPTLVIGSNEKIESFVYFWNIRATYPTSDIVWLPIEMIDDQMAKGIFPHYTHYCLFNDDRIDEIRQKIEKFNDLYHEIDISNYYYDIIEVGWNAYDHAQNVIIEKNIIRVIHPQGRLFSKTGYNINLAVQITGPDVTFLPKSLELGQLFLTYSPKEPQHFARMSSKGLTITFTDLNPLENLPSLFDIKIPTSEKIFNTLLKESGIILKETNDTQVMIQAVNKLKGFENIKILTDPVICQLIVELTPKRMKTLAETIAQKIKLGLDEEEIQRLLIENLEEIAFITKNKFYPVSQFESIIKKPINNKEKYREKIQQLYNLEILLRGKKVICPSCNSILWYPLSNLSGDLTCYCCNNPVILPVFNKDKAEEDYYRLNELFCTATDQGILPLLLTTYILNNQNFISKKFIFNYRLFEETNELGEIDIIFSFGNKIGLAEVKSNYNFKEDQLDRMLEISEKINADILVFSTLKEKDSEDIINLCNYLNSKKLKIPAFILTNKALFNEKSPILFDHLRELERDKGISNEPIIIE
jgi:RNase P subunit RPR2